MYLSGVDSALSPMPILDGMKPGGASDKADDDPFDICSVGECLMLQLSC